MLNPSAPGSGGGVLIGVVVMLFIISASVVALRILAKHLRRRAYELHDWFCFFSLVRERIRGKRRGS